MSGKVFLVGAGPGDPELLTVKALRILQAAQVVLHDNLIGHEILELIPASAEVRSVGKRCGRKSTAQAEINGIATARYLAAVRAATAGDADAKQPADESTGCDARSRTTEPNPTPGARTERRQSSATIRRVFRTWTWLANSKPLRRKSALAAPVMTRSETFGW